MNRAAPEAQLRGAALRRRRVTGLGRAPFAISPRARFPNTPPCKRSPPQRPARFGTPRTESQIGAQSGHVTEGAERGGRPGGSARGHGLCVGSASPELKPRDEVLPFHQKGCLLTISSSPRGAEKENKAISCHYDRLEMEPSYFNNTMR